MLKLLNNCRIFTETGEIIQGGILIWNDSIAGIYSINEQPEKAPDLIIDLEGRLVFPALINGHDHLYESFCSPCSGEKFANWFEWDKEFKSSPEYRRMQTLSITDLYALGMYRNVLSGVGMIVDHFPREISGTFAGKPLVALLDHYFLAHSVSQRRLEWGEGLMEEFRQSRGILPFILHACEGFAQEISEEIETLNRIGVLAENTVLVDCVNLSDSDLDLIAMRKASIVWCPTSTQAIFHAQPKISQILDRGIPFTIGTESAICGSVNLLDEARTARKFSQDLFGGRLSPLEIIHLLTKKAAAIFRTDKTQGSINHGKLANLLCFEDVKKDPVESFFSLTPKDISLLLHNGALVYGDEKYRSICCIDFIQFSEVVVEGRPKLLLGKAIQLLERIEHKLGEQKKFPFLPISSN